ncbi:hypothetical protein EU527_05585 [Candidatus Thorarchaeota archaeon]|nr:MAG: hypothetical protein EU527_05585 [Candidatus Thorarchaeota archaeon]
MSTHNDASRTTTIPKVSITVYGGKRQQVGESAKRLIGISDDEYYGTWINLGIMRRLGFLFEGGVESAGGLGEIICMFAVLIIVLAMFTLWNIAVVFLVVAVLTLLSGGAAMKFIRAVYIIAPLSNLDKSQVDEFVAEQVSLGRFVRIEGSSKDMNILTQKISAATLTFRTGIQFALVVASVFLVIQVIYFLMMNHWLSGLNPATQTLEIQVLTYFGLLFLFGVILMDVGVFMRSRSAKRLKV